MDVTTRKGNPNGTTNLMVTNPNVKTPTNPRNPAEIIATNTTPRTGITLGNRGTTSTHYAGKTSPGIGEPSISEPRVAIDYDTELRNLKEAVSQIQNHPNTLHHD
uniref:Uncharacterized protein n=1 Tax=Cannabis sativa TaxID=3483 RepID=A0A803PCE3_CANSA